MMTENRNLQTSRAKQSASPERIVDRLFQRLAATYGKHWLDMWVGIPIADVKIEWAGRLHGYAPETIGKALDHLARESKFPPTLPEFVALCREFHPRGRMLVGLPAPRAPAPDHVFDVLRKAIK